MLTESEFSKIENFVTKNGLDVGSGKSKVAELMEHIKTHFMISIPSHRASIKDCVGEARPKHVEQDESSKRESAIGFKVRTKGEGEMADEFRKKL